MREVVPTELNLGGEGAWATKAFIWAGGIFLELVIGLVVGGLTASSS